MSILKPPRAISASRSALTQRLGHSDCGVYAEVIAGGTVGVGDTIAVEEPTLL